MKRLSRKQIILISIFTIFFLFFLFLSSIVKYWVQKNSEELIGRKIELQELHFNYAKFSVRIKGFNLYEANGSDRFVSFKELYVNISPWRIFSNEYAVSQIEMDGLNVSVIQDNKGFNFDDLTAGSEEEVVDSAMVEKNQEMIRFAIHNIKFKNGFVRYQDLEKHNDLKLENINLELPLIAWNNEKSEMGIDFSLGDEGNVHIEANVDHSKERYEINLGINSVDISPFVTYLKDYMHVSGMQGKANTFLTINGSMVDFLDVFVKGDVSLTDFSLTDFSILDNDGGKFLATESAKVQLDSLHIGSSHYEIGTVHLKKPEVYASLYEDNTNFEKIFEPVMTTDTLAVENDTVSTDEPKLFYSVDSVIITDGLVQFSDHTLNRKFIYDIKDIGVNMGRLTEEASDIPVTYSINLNDGGKSVGEIEFSMKETFDFNFKGHVKKLELMSFSPYTEFYIARPITQGELNYDCVIDMQPNHMENQNGIKISEFNFGDKTDDPNAIKAPVRLALYLLKDQNDIIQFDLPVSGNPNDPDFRLGKIIWKTLKNFLIKTASKPFGVLGNIVGTNPENIEKIPFEFTKTKMNNNEISTLKKISEIISKKPELKFSFTQETDVEKEREYILLGRCVDEYYSSISQEAPKQSCKELKNWAKQSVEFKNFLMRDSTDRSLSIKELCRKNIGGQIATQLFDSLLVERNQMLASYLLDSLQVQQENFEVKTADLRNLSDQQKDPKYRVEVSLK